MNEFKILLKQISLYSLKAIFFTLLLIKKIFHKKTILLVSKEQIKSYSISPAFQVMTLILVFLLSAVFVRSLQYNSIMVDKSIEIMDLKNANRKFEDQVDSLNASLKEVNNYFKEVAQHNPEAITGQKVGQKVANLFGDLNLNEQDKVTAEKIADSNLVVDEIKEATIKRINDLEEKLSIAGVTLSDDNKVVLTHGKSPIKKFVSKDIDDVQNVISLNDKTELKTGQGGPFQEFTNELVSSAKSQILSITRNKLGIREEIQYLTNLERFINFAPLLSPLKDYYVSSSFGQRPDPFLRHSRARHEGMDMVGALGSKILSPSIGKVIFAGKLGGYGNAVVIDHGYGFTTRYGHLSQIHVNKGDVVKKEQIIATQGSTGRSTGPHLHYEVRYKNIPLNPKKFLMAGQELFKKSDSEVVESETVGAIANLTK